MRKKGTFSIQNPVREKKFLEGKVLEKGYKKRFLRCLLEEKKNGEQTVVEGGRAEATPFSNTRTREIRRTLSVSK